jgi:hypothetical protein
MGDLQMPEYEDGDDGSDSRMMCGVAFGCESKDKAPKSDVTESDDARASDEDDDDDGGAGVPKLQSIQIESEKGSEGPVESAVLETVAAKAVVEW